MRALIRQPISTVVALLMCIVWHNADRLDSLLAAKLFVVCVECVFGVLIASEPLLVDGFIPRTASHSVARIDSLLSNHTLGVPSIIQLL